MVDFNKMRDEASKELQSLIEKRKAIDRKIVGLEQTIKGLDAVCGSDTDPAPRKFTLDPLPTPPELQGLLGEGLTDAIRMLFRNSGILLLTPTGIRDQLVMYGYPLPLDNPLSAIHAVIRRLQENMEIAEGQSAEGKTGYRWLGQLERALYEAAMKSSLPPEDFTRTMKRGELYKAFTEAMRKGELDKK